MNHCRLRLLSWIVLSLTVVTIAGNTHNPSALSDNRIALRNLVAQADSGIPCALYRLAYLHDVGYDTIAVDSARSTELYTLAAEAGYAPALNYLGFRYYNGEWVKKDINHGIDLIEQAALAGDAQAANNMGWLLLSGCGVRHDRDKAEFWLTRAASGGVAQAQSMLADLLTDTQALNPDTLRAYDLYYKAVEGGIADAEVKLISLMKSRWQNLCPDSAVSLGIKFYTHRAPRAAVELFNIAADKGNAHAMTLLGDAYTRALGVGYDYQAALHNYLRGAIAGDPSAAFYLAELLEIFPDALNDNPTLPSLDTLLPQYWYDKAREKGVTNAVEAATHLFPDNVIPY